MVTIFKLRIDFQIELKTFKKQEKKIMIKELIDCTIIKTGNNNLLIEDQEKARSIIPSQITTIFHSWYNDGIAARIFIPFTFFPKWSRLKYLD